MSNYYVILTSVGAAKITNAQALGQTVQLTELAVGDGNGSAVAPSEDWLGLTNEVHRVAINQIYVHETNANWLVAEAVIPQDVGGWYIREVGLFDVDGDLIAVGSYPETYKPVLADGSARDLYIRVITEIGNASTVELKIDPAIVLATRGYVDDHAVLTAPHSATVEATPDRLMMRDSAGRAKIAAPSAADDIARKDTVDAVQSELTIHESDGAAHGSSSAATAETIMRRDSAGRAKIAAPSAADDIARKDTVDTVQSNLTAHESDGAAHGSSSAATAETIMRRDLAGRAKIAAPSAADDIARKDTVDTVQSNLTAHENDGAAHGSTSTATPDSIVRRDLAGRAKVAAPSAADDIARKDTVDAVTELVKSIAVSNWTLRKSAADNDWQSMIWSPERGQFCAVASSGTGNRVMASSDGTDWYTQESAADNAWESITWSPELGLYCAVASSGAGNRVMTSPDSATWTAQTSAADNSWQSVTWSPELGLFCAVASSGTGNRVMTSPDGITWAAQTSAADHAWRSVTWSSELGLLCAVGITTAEDGAVMTSPDGINWTLSASIPGRACKSVTWSPELGLFCTVGYSEYTIFLVTVVYDEILTSPDGVTWTPRYSGGASPDVFGLYGGGLNAVTWNPDLGLFCTVGGSALLSSSDGVGWTGRTIEGANNWTSVAWGQGRGTFAAVADSGSGNRAMTSLYLK